MPASTSTRLIRLDGLRGIAVLSVLLFHAGYFLMPSVAERLLPGGFLGVDIFFVLSGFLMTHILLERRQSYGRFYLRRVARIFPALYLLLAVQLVYIWAIGGHPTRDLRPYGLIALGMGNWGSSVGVSLPFGLGQTWSLGVEEQLYLLWPLALVVLGQGDPRRLKKMCLIGISASLVVKLVMLHAGVPADRIYAQTEGRLDDFLVGALVASVWHTGTGPVRHLRVWTALAGGFLAFALAAADPFASRWLYEGGFTAVAVSAGVVLYACLHQAPGTGLVATRPLRAAGRYSYSIYLWHPLIFLAVSRALPGSTAVRVVWATVLLLGISLISTKAVEEPLRRLAARASSPRPAPKEPVLAVTAGR
ncbi:MAG TPA: acyltransferase [Acidimicrobiales bacterium]|nr:acyltransferase [Acidimicrobiales bacterium]